MAKSKLHVSDRVLMKRHLLHRGLQLRVANKLGVDHSLVSLVISGKRINPKILDAIFAELRKIEKVK